MERFVAWVGFLELTLNSILDFTGQVLHCLNRHCAAVAVTLGCDHGSFIPEISHYTEHRLIGGVPELIWHLVLQGSYTFLP